MSVAGGGPLFRLHETAERQLRYSRQMPVRRPAPSRARWLVLAETLDRTARPDARGHSGWRWALPPGSHQ